MLFEESLNETVMSKQMDLIVRFWSTDSDGNHAIVSQYIDSQFLGHASSKELLDRFKSGLKDFNLSKLFSIGMDGPNVNMLI